eukprot:SAG11_NODE_13121_length_669_cov_0.733333_1_plen_56_part_00
MYHGSCFNTKFSTTAATVLGQGLDTASNFNGLQVHYVLLFTSMYQTVTKFSILPG